MSLEVESQRKQSRQGETTSISGNLMVVEGGGLKSKLEGVDYEVGVSILDTP